MTSTADHPDAPVSEGAGDARSNPTGVFGSAVAAVRRVPMALHVLALALVLLVLVPVIGTAGIAMADEGAALLQAQIVQRTGEWGVTSPTESIDPGGEWFPVPLSEESAGRWYPYTKHTIYPEVLVRLLSLGGYAAVLVFQVWGVVATAWLGSRLARRAAPRFEVLTLWVLGLGSPLFFDGYWAIAHSWGCAGAAAAVLGVLRVREGRAPSGAALTVAGLVLVGAMRSEGTLLGIALALAIVATGWRRDRRGAVLLGLAALVTTTVTYLGSAELERVAMGGAHVAPFRITDSHQGFIEGRVSGLWYSLLLPQLHGNEVGWFLCLVGALGCLVAWWCARARPTETVIISGAAVVAWAAWTLRLGLPLRPVPGLFVASPVLLAGAISWRRRLRNPERDLLLGTALLFSFAVIATQYGTGATGDWGGRYFRLVLPLVVPICLIAISETLRSVAPATRRVLLGSLVGSVVAVTVLAAMTQQRMHEVTTLQLEATTTAAASLRSAVEPGGAVVVSTRGEFGRFAWDQVLDHRYLGVPEPADLPRVAAALEAADVPDLAFVGPSDEVETGLDAWRAAGFEVTSRRSVEDAGWEVVVLDRGA